MFFDDGLLAKYLPPAIGIIILIVGAGFMGLFRATRLQKGAFSDTVESLMRQLEVIKDENNLLHQQLDILHTQLEVLSSINAVDKKQDEEVSDVFKDATSTNPLTIRKRPNRK
jgi:hypothetical protein